MKVTLLEGYRKKTLREQKVNEKTLVLIENRFILWNKTILITYLNITNEIEWYK